MEFRVRVAWCFGVDYWFGCDGGQGVFWFKVSRIPKLKDRALQVPSFLLDKVEQG